MNGAYSTPASEDGLSLPVAEMFYSIQGEGYNTGKPAYFVRLGGCDVHCPWCDSKSTWNPRLYPLVAIEDILREISLTPAVNVVVTGGEPLMHPLGHLCDALKAKGLNIFLETSGTHPLSGQFDWICVSPKKHRPPLVQVLSAADEIKVVIGSEADLLWAEKNRKGVNERCRLFLQPEWDRRDLALPLIAEYAKKHPRWRISLQTHKYMNIP
ncbi:MAG TPA: 7-carboxy-7-deazaguanine synthase QueE [Candidatus Coprenecus pullistercoris]|nr:7-carboxy-7-deazaguanine synthase QueE [Candidatus Coprenecus pullistercoris]